MIDWKIHLAGGAVSILWTLFCVLLADFFDFPIRAGVCYGLMHGPLMGLFFERWLRESTGSVRRQQRP